jgi:hypothetical protein
MKHALTLLTAVLMALNAGAAAATGPLDGSAAPTPPLDPAVPGPECESPAPLVRLVAGSARAD